MVDDIVKRLAGEQRKRLIAGLLGAAEHSTWWNKITREEQRTFRDKVLASAGTYHDFMLDVIKVGHEDMTVNAHAIELIEAVHAGQRRMEARLGGQ